MLLYKNMVLQESGDLPKALAHLEEIEPNVVDRLSLLYTRGARQIVLSPNLLLKAHRRRLRPASLLLGMERYDEAKKQFEQLLDTNADNHLYHTGLQCAHCRTTEKREQLSVRGTPGSTAHKARCPQRSNGRRSTRRRWWSCTTRSWPRTRRPTQLSASPSPS